MILILIGAAVLYVAFLVWIAFGRVIHARLRDVGARERADACLEHIFGLDLFEDESPLLWETQTPALALLHSAGPDGVTLSELRKPYSALARAYPELYEGSTFEGWIALLEKAEIAEDHGEAIMITDKGLFALDVFRKVHSESRVTR